MLVVLKDGVEVLEAPGRQQADGRDHVGHRARGKGAAGEANQDDVVARDIVGADKVVRLTNDLGW